ncbi:Uncharacterized protein FKW44_005032 [Caligus rogercresseyi]|uniref:Uncharacterized protein n=1 Tax=Caligus rogercresseyi TaxID=217165 RepID=A0A7T8HMF9_CALRO|nr:Uncharacterized protein FKW44_005032 [Caligus rogercresseyi]
MNRRNISPHRHRIGQNPRTTKKSLPWTRAMRVQRIYATKRTTDRISSRTMLYHPHRNKHI